MPLRIPRAIKRVAVAFAITVAVIGAAHYYAITPHLPSPPPQSALSQADALSLGNRWEDALPLYRRAQQLFLSQHNASKALYAEVSEIPPDESVSFRQTLLGDTDTAKKLVLRAWSLSPALSIYEMQLIPAPHRCSLTKKKFARGVKKRLPQAAYQVDAQNRDILERVELERDSAFQYGRLLLDAGRGAFRSVSPTLCEEESMLALPCSHSPCRSRPGTSLLDFSQRF